MTPVIISAGVYTMVELKLHLSPLISNTCLIQSGIPCTMWIWYARRFQL